MSRSNAASNAEIQYLTFFDIEVDIEKVLNEKIKSALKRIKVRDSIGHKEHSDYSKHSRYSACGPLLFY